MDTKAAFEKLMNIGHEDEDIFETLLTSLFENLEVLSVLQKPAVQTLLSSSLMRDAVDSIESPALTELYNQLYTVNLKIASRTVTEYILNGTYYILPALVLVLVIGAYVRVRSILLLINNVTISYSEEVDRSTNTRTLYFGVTFFLCRFSFIHHRMAFEQQGTTQRREKTTPTVKEGKC